VNSNKKDFNQDHNKGLPHTSEVTKHKTRNFLKKLNVKENGLPSQTLLSFVIDHSQNKYSCIDSPYRTTFGYTIDYLEEAGPHFFKSLIHKSDLKVYDSHILPQIVQFLKRQHQGNHADFSFSYNYRIKTKENAAFTVLQRSVFLLHQDTGNLVAEYGFVMDITHFKEDTKIIFTIEQTKTKTLHNEVLLKSVYLPHSRLFSRREQEILQLIYQGAGSKQIAEKLFVSINTINNHRKNMLNKTGSKNFAQLIAYAIRNGIICLFYFISLDYSILCCLNITE
jgi:DNA-binding CsgD family transcriptional regulator